jgi:hypothetical protein
MVDAPILMRPAPTSGRAPASWLASFLPVWQDTRRMSPTMEVLGVPACQPGAFDHPRQRERQGVVLALDGHAQGIARMNPMDDFPPGRPLGQSWRRPGRTCRRFPPCPSLLGLISGLAILVLPKPHPLFGFLS